jgi:hypothetical protein
MPKGNMDHTGHVGHCLFVLSGLVYNEFNSGDTNNSYVRRNQKRTHVWIPPYVLDGSTDF